MKKLIPLLLILTLLCSGLTACQEKSDTSETTAATAPQRAENALEFTVTDTDGNPVKLSDFTGKPVVVNFWATWCNPCTTELPEFEAAAKANPDIQFMMVNVTDGRDETPEKVMAFIEKHGYTFDVYYDHGLTVTNMLQLRGFPTTYFIDAQGVVVNSYLGMMDTETLEQGLQLIR